MVCLVKLQAEIMRTISKSIAIKNTKYVYRKSVINASISAVVKWELVYAVFGKNLMKI